MALLELKRIVLIIGAVAIMAMVMPATEGPSALLDPGLLLMIAWICLPLVVLERVGREDDPRAVRGALALTALVMVAAGIGLYFDALMVNSDAQGALASVFVPGLQLAISVPALVYTYVSRRRARAAAPAAGEPVRSDLPEA
jgi:hypothetical protein